MNWLIEEITMAKSLLQIVSQLIEQWNSINARLNA